MHVHRPGGTGGTKQLSHVLSHGGARWFQARLQYKHSTKTTASSNRNQNASSANRRQTSLQDGSGSNNNFDLDSGSGDGQDMNVERHITAMSPTDGSRLAALYDKYAAGGNADAATVVEVIRAKQLAAARRARAAALTDAAAEAIAREQGVRDYLTSRGLGAISQFRDMAETEAKRALAELEEADVAALEAEVAAQGGDLEADWAAVETSRSTTGRAKAAASNRPGLRGEPLPDNALLSPPSNPQVERLRTQVKQMRRKRRLFDREDDEVDGSMYDEPYSSGSDDDFSLTTRARLQRPSSAAPAGPPSRLTSPTPNPFRTLQGRPEEETAELDMEKLLDNLYEDANSPVYSTITDLRSVAPGDDVSVWPALAAKPTRPGVAARPGAAAKPSPSPTTGRAVNLEAAPGQVDDDYDALMELLESVGDDLDGQDLGLGQREDNEDGYVGMVWDGHAAADGLSPAGGKTSKSKRPLTTTSLMRGGQATTATAAFMGASNSQLLGKPGAAGARGGPGLAAAGSANAGTASRGRASAMMDDDTRFLEELLSGDSFFEAPAAAAPPSADSPRSGGSRGASLQSPTQLSPLLDEDEEDDLGLLASPPDATPSSRLPSLESRPVARSRAAGVSSSMKRSVGQAAAQGGSAGGSSGALSGSSGSQASSARRPPLSPSRQALQDQEELLRGWEMGFTGEELLPKDSVGSDAATARPRPYDTAVAPRLLDKPMKQAVAAPGARGGKTGPPSAAFRARDLDLVLEGMLDNAEVEELRKVGDLRSEEADDELRFHSVVPPRAPVVQLMRPSRGGPGAAAKAQTANTGEASTTSPPASAPVLATATAGASDRVESVSAKPKEDASAPRPKPAAPSLPAPQRSAATAVTTSPAPAPGLGAAPAVTADPANAVESLASAAAVLSDPSKAAILEQLAAGNAKLARPPPRQRSKAKLAATAVATPVRLPSVPTQPTASPRETGTKQPSAKGPRDAATVAGGASTSKPARRANAPHGKSSAEAEAGKGATSTAAAAVDDAAEPLVGSTDVDFGDSGDLWATAAAELGWEDSGARAGDPTADLSEGVREVLREWRSRESPGPLAGAGRADDATGAAPQAFMIQPPRRQMPAGILPAKPTTSSSRSNPGPSTTPPGAAKVNRVAGGVRGPGTARRIAGQPETAFPAPEHAPTHQLASASAAASRSAPARGPRPRTGTRASAVRAWRPGRALVPQPAPDGKATAADAAEGARGPIAQGLSPGRSAEDAAGVRSDVAGSGVASGPAAARPVIMALRVWERKAPQAVKEAELQHAAWSIHPQRTAERGADGVSEHESASRQGETSRSHWASRGHTTGGPFTMAGTALDTVVSNSSIGAARKPSPSFRPLQRLRQMLKRGELVHGFITDFQTSTCTALVSFPGLVRFGVAQPVALGPDQLHGWRDWAALAARRDNTALATGAGDHEAAAEAAPSAGALTKASGWPSRKIWAAITAIHTIGPSSGKSASNEQAGALYRVEMTEVTRPRPSWCRAERAEEPTGPRKVVALNRGREVVAHVVSITERGAYCELHLLTGTGLSEAAACRAAAAETEAEATESEAVAPSGPPGGLPGAGSGARLGSTPNMAGRGGSAAHAGGRELHGSLLCFLAVEHMAPVLVEAWSETVELDRASRRQVVAAALGAAGAGGAPGSPPQPSTCIMRAGDVVEAKVVGSCSSPMPGGPLLLVHLYQPYNRLTEALTAPCMGPTSILGPILC